MASSQGGGPLGGRFLSGHPAQVHRLTPLAKKYRHPSEKDIVMPDPMKYTVPYKSGLTPLPRPPHQTWEDADEYDQLRVFQMARFSGFETSYLEAMGCLPSSITDVVDTGMASTPIHPLFQRQNWKSDMMRHQFPPALRKGRDGYWEGSNQEVWDLIRPALHIASQILERAPVWQWWDALINGPLTDVPDADLVDGFRGERVCRFESRPTVDFKSTPAKRNVRQFFLDLAGEIDFSFLESYTEYTTGLSPEIIGGITHGETIPRMHSHRDKVTVLLAHHLAEPLFRDDLTSAERAIENFRLATVLIHEIAHAVFMAGIKSRYAGLHYEPFFEGEAIAELGFSVEHAIFGGIPRGIVATFDVEGRPVPAGGVFEDTWCTIRNDGYAGSPHLLYKPSSYWDSFSSPIFCHYFTDVHNRDFWDCYVTKYGGDSLKMPKAMSTPFNQPLQKTIPIFLGFPLLDELDIPMNANALDTTAVTIENHRRKAYLRIINNVQLYEKDLSKLILDQHKNEANLPRRAATGGKVLFRKAIHACPRYDEIEKYLIANRVSLAIDTMSTTQPLPENLMLGYIRRCGGLKITSDEWRDFLAETHRQGRLFHYTTTYNVGAVRRLKTGWPNLPVPQPVHHARPLGPRPDSELVCFKYASKMLIEDDRVFRHGFTEQDFMEYIKYLNGYMRAPLALHMIDTETGQPRDRFDGLLAYKCLWWCHQEMDMFAFGPRGVIRWRGTLPPGDMPPPPGTRVPNPGGGRNAVPISLMPGGPQPPPPPQQPPTQQPPIQQPPGQTQGTGSATSVTVIDPLAGIEGTGIVAGGLPIDAGRPWWAPAPPPADPGPSSSAKKRPHGDFEAGGAPAKKPRTSAGENPLPGGNVRGRVEGDRSLTTASSTAHGIEYVRDKRGNITAMIDRCSHQ